jgi:hypothetical protein
MFLLDELFPRQSRFKLRLVLSNLLLRSLKSNKHLVPSVAVCVCAISQQFILQSQLYFCYLFFRQKSIESRFAEN